MRASLLKFCTLAAAAILSSAPPSIRAQATVSAATSAPASPKAPAYAGESIVIEQADSIYTYAADGTGIQDHTVVARVQSDAAVRALGVVSIAYASNSQKVEFLYARVRHPDGTVVESVPADAIEMPAAVTREAPFYSDIKEKQLPIRSMRVGDTLEWKARITTTKSEAPGQTWGQETFVEDTVNLGETIELRVPAGLSLKVWSPTAKPVESDLPADGTTPALHVYRWTTSQLKPTAGKEAEAAAEAKKKAVWTADQEIDAEQGKLPTIAWTTFKSWDEVGSWYRALEADRTTPSPEIKAKVAELIAGKATDEEKVRALYGYVATQIRYIGVAFGVGRFQPHTAAEILANQYGDCKDKHTLLAAMLDAAGIQADAVLIGAGVRFNPDVPSPAAFNHLITHLTVAGQPVWLDTTAEIAPYNMLVAVTRDKQALIVPASSAATPYISRTPANPPFATFQTMDAVGTIDKDGVTHSRLTMVFRGDTELAVRAAFHQTAPAQYNELVQQIVRNFGYGGTSSNADVTRPEDTTVPFKMSFDYERDKPNDWTNYQIVPQVAPVSLTRFSDSDPLVRVLDLGLPRVETSHAALKIPEGWGATLPAASHHKCAWASYDETYRLDKGTIYTERRIQILKQKVPVADLKTYKKWADEADLGNELYIQLTRTSAVSKGATASADKNAVASSSGPPVMLPGSEEAATLMNKAGELYRQHDFEGEARVLDQVKAIDPTQTYLWSMYGMLALMHQKPLEAMADLQKEATQHPASFPLYDLLIQLEGNLGTKKDVADTLRGWAAAAPTDPKPVSLQMIALVEDGDAKDAAALGEAALAKFDGDAKRTEPFRVELGVAQLKSGENLKGRATLEEILKDTDEALILNDAAYELADANLDLALAEKSMRTAIDKVTEQSSTASFDELGRQLFLQTTLIMPMWDSMGWVLFREGKFEEAQSYLQASWLGTTGGVNGEHLGDLLLARGEKAAAMAAYELALASSPTHDGMGVRRPPGPEEQKLQRKIDALKKAGIKSTIATEADPYKVLQSMRTIPLDGVHSGEADAEYRILLRAGKVVKVQPTGAKSIAGAEDWIAKVDFSKYFPVGSQVTLIRNGFVNCHGKVCDLFLEP